SHGDESHTGFNEASGQEHALPGGVAAILITQLGWFSIDVERFLGLLRRQQAVGSLIERIHRRDVVSLLLGGEVSVDGFEHASASLETFDIHAAWQIKVLHTETAVSGVTSQTEWCVGST